MAPEPALIGSRASSSVAASAATGRPSRGRAVVLALALALVAAGCGSGGAGTGESAAVPAAEVRPAPAPAPTTTTAPSPTGAVPTAPSQPWGATLPPGAVPADVSRPTPVALRIPALGVDAPVVAAGLAADGALDLLPDVVSVAWFRGGAAPGESGSAVLAAHVDHDGREGVFFRLAALDGGTEVEVAMSDGATRRFATAGGAVEYDKVGLPVDELFRRGDAPVLTLVTCGGPFDARARSYERNVVVTAVPVAG